MRAPAALQTAKDTTGAHRRDRSCDPDRAAPAARPSRGNTATRRRSGLAASISRAAGSDVSQTDAAAPSPGSLLTAAG